MKQQQSFLLMLSVAIFINLNDDSYYMTSC